MIKSWKEKSFKRYLLLAKKRKVLNMVETSFDRRALTEVYNVLIMLDKESFDKIPKKMIQAIKNNMDTEYEVQWDEIEKGNLLEDTEKILSVLYTDYLATPEEKNIIMQLENIKYKDCYPVFKNRVKKENINEEKIMVEVKKENWFMKLVGRIKEFLKLKQ